jgi:hypothetical protein
VNKKSKLVVAAAVAATLPPTIVATTKQTYTSNFTASVGSYSKTVACYFLSIFSPNFSPIQQKNSIPQKGHKKKPNIISLFWVAA